MYQLAVSRMEERGGSVNGAGGEVLEGGGRGVGILELLHLLHLLDLGVGPIGAIGVIGLISLEVWIDGLCTGHPSRSLCGVWRLSFGGIGESSLWVFWGGISR